MTNLTPLALLSVGEYFNKINWNNNQDQKVEKKHLSSLPTITVANFFSTINWSGISVKKNSSEQSQLSEKNLSLLSVKDFFQLTNWKGITKDFSQGKKPLSLNVTVEEFFQGIKWEENSQKFPQKEENLPSFLMDDTSFSLDDLSGLF